MKNGAYANKHVQANKKCVQTPNRETRMEKIDNHKGPSKRGHIVSHDASWARIPAGHKMNIVFTCCANWETFVADTKCF